MYYKFRMGCPHVKKLKSIKRLIPSSSQTLKLRGLEAASPNPQCIGSKIRVRVKFYATLCNKSQVRFRGFSVLMLSAFRLSLSYAKCPLCQMSIMPNVLMPDVPDTFKFCEADKFLI